MFSVPALFYCNLISCNMCYVENALKRDHTGQWHDMDFADVSPGILDT